MYKFMYSIAVGLDLEDGRETVRSAEDFYVSTYNWSEVVGRSDSADKHESYDWLNEECVESHDSAHRNSSAVISGKKSVCNGVMAK